MLPGYRQTPAAITDRIVRFARDPARRARKLDGEAPRRSATIGGAQFVSVGLNLGSVRMGLQGWAELTVARGRDTFRIRELHRQDERFVVKGLWSTSTVLDLHHQVILIRAKPHHVAALVHDDKQEGLAAFGSHLSDQGTGAAIGSG